MVPPNAQSDTHQAGATRYYLFNSMLHARRVDKPFALNDSDGPNLDIALGRIDGLVSWEFTAYYLRVTYWPLATVTELLDLQIGKILRDRTAVSHELFPYASDKQVSPYPVDKVQITPSATLPDLQSDKLTTDREILEGQREAGFKPDRFTKASPQTSHRRVYDLCKNSYEHGDSAPIIELDNIGEYDKDAFRTLVEPLEKELMLLNGVLTARVAREQAEVTYRAGLPLEVLDHFVCGVIVRFYRRTKDDISLFSLSPIPITKAKTPGLFQGSFLMHFSLSTARRHDLQRELPFMEVLAW